MLAPRDTVAGVSALRFNVVYEDAGEGWVCAHVPSFPRSRSKARVWSRRVRWVLDAIAMALDERRARGELIPEPGWALVESVEIAA